MRAARIALKALAWLILGILALGLTTILTAILVARSEWGKRKLLAVALPALRQRVHGRLHIGRLDGDLTRTLVLHDVAIDDGEGRPAIRVRTLAARYDLFALGRRTIDVRELAVEGAWVHAQPLRDGTLNLVALLRPPPAEPNARRYRVRLGRVKADVEALYDGPAPPQHDGPAPPQHDRAAPPQHLHAHVEVDGRAQVDGPAITVTIASLGARAQAPLTALVTGHGQLAVRDGAIAAQALELELTTEGRELARLVPSPPPLRGRWSATLRADGPAERLALMLALRPPAGRLDVAAELSTRAGAALAALRWRATVTARAIDPAAALAGAPRGDLRLDARAAGQGRRATLDVAALEATVAGAALRAHGRLDSAGHVAAVARLDAPDLSRLRGLGIAQLAGALRLDARLDRRAGTLAIDADVAGTQLSAGAVRVGAVALHVHTRNTVGALTLRATAIVTRSLRLDSVSLDAGGTLRAIALRLAARGPDGTALDLALHGQPTRARRGRSISGAELTIDRLALARHDQLITLARPAQLGLHRVVTLAALILVSGHQQLTLDGKFDRATQAFTLALHGTRLDLARLARLARPSPDAPARALDLPVTALDVTVQAHGTRRAPRVDVALAGWAQRPPPRDERIHYRAELHYGDGRARGQLEATAGAGARLAAALDLPLALARASPLAPARESPLSLRLELANLSAQQLRELLPARLAALDGRLDGEVTLSGTTLRPRLALTLHARALGLPAARDNEAHLALDYSERRLTADAGVTLGRTRGGNAGQVTARVALPLALTAAALRQPSRLVAALLRETALDARVTITRLDMARLGALGLTPPVAAGLVDGALRLHGTLLQPLVDVELEAQALKRGRLDHLDLYADGHYKDGQATAALEAHLRDAPLVSARASLALDAQRLGAWRDAPLVVDAAVPRYPLARLRDLVPRLDGALALTAALRGTPAHPTGRLAATVTALQLGAMAFDRFGVDGAFDGQVVTARLDAAEHAGGTLAGQARLPLAATAPLQASLRARAFRVDFAGFELANPRLLAGRLDAQLDAAGSRAAPALAGALHFSDGKLGLAADPRVYDRIALDAQLRNDRLTLQRLEAHLADGSLLANGAVTLAGLLPRTLELRAYARHFPVEPGNFAVWLDADVTVNGEGDARGLRGTVRIDKGTANLPKLAGGKKLQSTGPLADVRFVDPAALAAERRRREAATRAATAQLTATIPGPFHLRSKELSTDLKGQLELSIAGPVLRLAGHLEQMSSGWVDLFGRRYNIDKARVGFGGEAEPNPELDVKLTRDVSNATIVIEVHGTAKKPQLVLASDPPIYDQSQVIAIILSGDPATQRVDDRSLDQKVTGAFSSLIVGRIKDQLAPNLPIDVIKVDTGSEGVTGLGDTRVEVGKYLTDTIYVSYVHQFGSTMVGTQRLNANEANLNWRFYRHYELDTAFGDAAVGHLNLFWTIRF